MTIRLPTPRTLLLKQQGSTLTITFNRPEVRNAMSLELVGEIEQVVDAVRDTREIRTLVLRGAGGHFCAGADIKEMAAVRQAPALGGPADAMVQHNRRFGTMITKVDRAPQAVVAVLEGCVLGGGMGLACVADVALTLASTTFGLPETGLGLVPAQIATFLVRRMGLSQSRRLAVTGGRFDGAFAQAIGLVHVLCQDQAALEAELMRLLEQIDRCAPEAIAVTKRLMLLTGTEEHEALLDQAAEAFAAAARGPEGAEGMAAFIGNRQPGWVSSAR